MRIVLFALLLPSAWATTALAQQPHVSGTADAALLTAASIQRIRAALEHPPAITLTSVDRAAQFRVVIREPQRFLERPPLDFSAGPVPPGGLYAYEQRQRIGPKIPQPLVIVDLLPIAHAIAGAVGGARRAGAQAAAHEEVQRGIAGYCAAQPNQGAGIQICAMSPATR